MSIFQHNFLSDIDFVCLTTCMYTRNTKSVIGVQFPAEGDFDHFYNITHAKKSLSSIPSDLCPTAGMYDEALDTGIRRWSKVKTA